VLKLVVLSFITAAMSAASASMASNTAIPLGHDELRITGERLLLHPDNARRVLKPGESKR
jgi:hypothetical protein